MKGKADNIRAEKDVDVYGYKYLSNDKDSQSSGRLDLNDLLKRIKNEKKDLKKNNLIIFAGAASLAAVVLIILNL
tara:strand:+ start:381 stop:605 length:225 start_codon:yes stop_codon:yes gene_type:complete